MPPERPRPLAAALALLLTLLAAPAHAVTGRDLAGWWLAVDDTFPLLWGNGLAVRTEELLLVDTEGRAEDRVFSLTPGLLAACPGRDTCSDAPLVARFRLVIDGERLSLADREETTAALDEPEANVWIRKLVIGAAPSWTLRQEGEELRPALRSDAASPSWWFRLAANGRRLELRAAPGAGPPARVLVKLAPERLRGLWAGFQVAEAGFPADDLDRWRCYLARATAGDAAFAGTLDPGPAPPAFLADYLRAAAYLNALGELAARPTPDDPAPDPRTVVQESLLIAGFPDIRPPAAWNDTHRLLARYQALLARAAGRSPAETASAGIIGEPPARIPLAEAEIRALGRVLDPNDAEGQRLACRDPG